MKIKNGVPENSRHHALWKLEWKARCGRLRLCMGKLGLGTLAWCPKCFKK